MSNLFCFFYAHYRSDAIRLTTIKSKSKSSSMLNKSFFLFAVIGCLIISLSISCKDDNPTVNTPPPVETPKKKVSVPKFDRDTAYQYVAKQVGFGIRLMETEGHTKTKAWLTEMFKSFGAEVIQQDFIAETYNGKKYNSTNIIAQYNPAAKKRILLGAHWDTRHIADSPLATEKQSEPIMGADDGGSGVGVLLEIARQIHANPIDIGVDIVLFDAEDHGAPRDYEIDDRESMFSWCLGSQHWSKNPHVAGYRADFGILLDMVGTKNATFTKEGTSMQYAPQIMNKVWKLAQGMGYGNYFLDKRTSALTDDHAFVNAIAGIPMIDIINHNEANVEGFGESGFGEHWHTHNDDLDVIDKRTLRAAGQVVLAVIYRADAGKF
ncbi:MAG: M28 family peptidase [Saprospiraceae bacterium]